MTKEEADAMVQRAEVAVLRAARLRTLDAPAAMLSASLRLQSAERCRAALDEPRLRSPSEIMRRMLESAGDPKAPLIATGLAIQLMEHDRADIITQAEKLPRFSDWIMRDDGERDAILLSDFRKLINGTAA